jgi:hypothetical protein
MQFSVLSLPSVSARLPSSQKVAQGPGVCGPALETVHLYYDEWPTGTAFFIFHDQGEF